MPQRLLRVQAVDVGLVLAATSPPVTVVRPPLVPAAGAPIHGAGRPVRGVPVTAAAYAAAWLLIVAAVCTVGWAISAHVNRKVPDRLGRLHAEYLQTLKERQMREMPR